MPLQGAMNQIRAHFDGLVAQGDDAAVAEARELAAEMIELAELYRTETLAARKGRQAPEGAAAIAAAKARFDARFA